MPRATRPPVSTEAVATALATVKGLRMGSTKTLVVKCSRSVAAPMAPMATHGSSHGVNASPPSLAVVGVGVGRGEGLEVEHVVRARAMPQ